ncbi:AAA family ATPase [Sphingomonas oryzagri]
MLKTINPDAFLETEDGRVWTPERNAEAWQRAYSALESVLKDGEVSRVVVVCGLQGAGKSTWIDVRPNDEGVIYFDAALPAAKHRKPLIDIARRYGATIEAVWIRVPLNLALERNKRREPDKIVPEESILSVAARFEEPSTDEGFLRVIVVN